LGRRSDLILVVTGVCFSRDLPSSCFNRGPALISRSLLLGNDRDSKAGFFPSNSPGHLLTLKIGLPP
jgi:hypothetical protein